MPYDPFEGTLPRETFSKGRECAAEAEGAGNFDEGVLLGRGYQVRGEEMSTHYKTGSWWKLRRAQKKMNDYGSVCNSRSKSRV